MAAQSSARAQEWSRFEWVSATVGGRASEKGAICLPVTISGLTGTFSMQLDTGSSRSMLYGVPYLQLLEKQGAPRPELPSGESSTPYSAVSFSGSIGRFRVNDLPVLLHRDYGMPVGGKNKHPVIGTIGLDVVKEHTLLLDFPERRFAFLDKEDGAGLALMRRARFFDVMVRNGLLFVPVFYDEQPLEGVFYDTGSSLFPLVTTRSIWQRLTGRTGDEPDNERLTISSWGKQVVMTGARLEKLLRVGPFRVGKSVVYFAPADAGSLNFEKWPFEVGGAVGNAAFYDDCMVILDLPRSRMAVLRSKNKDE